MKATHVLSRKELTTDSHLPSFSLQRLVLKTTCTLTKIKKICLSALLCAQCKYPVKKRDKWDTIDSVTMITAFYYIIYVWCQYDTGDTWKQYETRNRMSSNECSQNLTENQSNTFNNNRIIDRGDVLLNPFITRPAGSFSFGFMKP